MHQAQFRCTELLPVRRLPGTEHKYVSFIIEKGQTIAGGLPGVSVLATSAVAGLTDEFEKKNLVKKQFASNDRRKVIIEPISWKYNDASGTALCRISERSEKWMASLPGTELLFKSH